MSSQGPISILRVDSSGRSQASTTRRLADLLLARLEQVHGAVEITRRDVSTGLPFVDQEWIEANFTDPADRSPSQRRALAHSDRLVGELKGADVLVLAVPVYNFGIPAALKAWVDLVARARETFRYTETGPVGLLKIRKAYLVVASGGTGVGSEIDFATTYLRHVLGFLGIDHIEIVAADRAMVRGDEALASAEAEIGRLSFVDPAPGSVSSREPSEQPVGASS